MMRCGNRNAHIVDRLVTGALHLNSERTPPARSVRVLFEPRLAEPHDRTHALDVREIVQQDLTLASENPRCKVDPLGLGVVGEVILQPTVMPPSIADMLRRNGERRPPRARVLHALLGNRDHVDVQLSALGRDCLVVEVDPALQLAQQGSLGIARPAIAPVEPRFGQLGIGRARQSQRVLARVGIGRHLHGLPHRRPDDRKPARRKLLERAVSTRISRGVARQVSRTHRRQHEDRTAHHTKLPKPEDRF